MARVSIHRCKIERWSTCILAQIWSLYGHVARGEYSYVFNAGMERNAMVANPTIYPRVLGRECISLSLSLSLCLLVLCSPGAKRASQAPRRERETTFWPPAEWIHEGDNILTYLKEMDASSYAKDIVARSGSAGFYCGNMRHDTYSVEVCTGKHHGLGKEQVN